MTSMETRDILDGLDELVNGTPWVAATADQEYKLVKCGRSWIERCCGQRARNVYPRMRYKDANKFPPESRRAKQWWGWHYGWVCEKCGYAWKRD